MTAEESTRTTRWLLRQLEEAIGHYLKSACKHRKYGTILYRAGGDLLHALSSALGSKCTSTDDQSITLQSSAKIPLEEAIQVVGEEMNGKIHQLAGIFLAQEQFDYRMIQFDQLIESTDTQLWRLITMMTASKKMMKNKPETLQAYTKKIRQFYCLCTLLFCTNNRCCMPVHVLLTDVIKAGGGSSESVKILNRFGAIASEDTHSRLVTHISSIREKEIQLEMTPDAFRLASIDNVDVLPLHASAYAGKPSNIWHGTSIQCVEPKPESLVHTSKSDKQTNTSHQSNIELTPSISTSLGELEAQQTVLGVSLSQVDMSHCAPQDPLSLSQPVTSHCQLGAPQDPLSLSQPVTSHCQLGAPQDPLSLSQPVTSHCQLGAPQDPLSLSQSHCQLGASYDSLSQADSPLVVSQSVSQLGASNIPHTQPETPHSSLLASQVSLSQLGMRSPLGVSQITLSQADTNCSTMIAPMALLSQSGTSPSPLLAHPQASCSVLPTESHREAEESTEPTTIAHTPSHTESAQSSESNKRHITKLSNATPHKQKDEELDMKVLKRQALPNT